MVMGYVNHSISPNSRLTLTTTHDTYDLCKILLTCLNMQLLCHVTCYTHLCMEYEYRESPLERAWYMHALLP